MKPNIRWLIGRFGIEGDPIGVSPTILGGSRAIRLPNGFATSPAEADSRAFMECQISRCVSDSYRIVYVGELSPRAGVAEFLSVAISWAETNGNNLIEIMWLGEGDSLGILQAQPAPVNLRQVFARIPTPVRLASLFARCGLFVMPSLTGRQRSWITEAMAAGLPVLGSVRDAHVRAFVVQNETGWLFDPLRETEIAAALSSAMTATPVRLNEMRAAARARIMVAPHAHSR